MDQAAGTDSLEVLLLQAGVWEPARARGAWDEFCARVDDVEALAGASYALFPLVAVNLQPLTPTLPHGSYLQSVLKYSWARSQKFLSAALPMLQALRDEEIDFIVSQGVALTSLYYQHWGARPTMTLGVLVHPQDVEKAIRILLRNGFAPPANSRLEHEKDLLRFGHALLWSHPDKFDFHLCWHLFQPCALESDEVNPWHRTTPCHLPGFATKSLNATDLFLQTCLEETGADPVSDFTRLADAAILLHDGNLDWPALESRARYLQRIIPVRDFILRLDRLDLGVPKSSAGHWRKILPGALERMEEACRPGLTRRTRIKSLALAYLRLTQGERGFVFWQNLGAYLRQLTELKGVARRIALAWYVLRWHRLRVTEAAR